MGLYFCKVVGKVDKWHSNLTVSHTAGEHPIWATLLIIHLKTRENLNTLSVSRG